MDTYVGLFLKAKNIYTTAPDYKTSLICPNHQNKRFYKEQFCSQCGTKLVEIVKDIKVIKKINGRDDEWLDRMMIMMPPDDSYKCEAILMPNRKNSGGVIISENTKIHTFNYCHGEVNYNYEYDEFNANYSTYMMYLNSIDIEYSIHFGAVRLYF